MCKENEAWTFSSEDKYFKFQEASVDSAKAHTQSYEVADHPSDMVWFK